MCDSATVIRLYSNVLSDAVKENRRPNSKRITAAIRNINDVYLPEIASLKSQILNVADYNDSTHRFAYLHKYAPFHTALMADMLLRATSSRPGIFDDIILNSGGISLCSLGAGPGCDALALMIALHKIYGLSQISATLVDFMIDWRLSFCSILEELRTGRYGSLGKNANPRYFGWSYLSANLLEPLSEDVMEAISSVEILTMIKFLSAAACQDTETMVLNIFRTMKPGAMLLFIDNAAGGYHQLVTRVARHLKFDWLFGPLQHEQYTNEAFKIKRFGYTACYETKVTVHLLQKPFCLPHPQELSSNFLTSLQINVVTQTRNSSRRFARTRSDDMDPLTDTDTDMDDCSCCVIS